MQKGDNIERSDKAMQKGDNIIDNARSKAKNNSAIDNDELVGQINQKKRGSKSASIEATVSATSEEIKSAINSVLYWRKRERVKTDEECAERLNEFFDHINETGEIPTVEKMCLALGTVRQVVWEWEQGKRGEARADMIKKAKEILAGIDAELVSRGKIPQVTYIFRAKNFFGMRDQAEYIITPNTPLGAEASENELAKHITDGVIIDGEGTVTD